MGPAAAMSRKRLPARVRGLATPVRLLVLWCAWLRCACWSSGVPADQGDLADAGTASSGLRWRDGSLTALEWAQHAVAVAVSRISTGTLRKVVLARDVFATAA